jgi:hypothetical protein
MLPRAESACFAIADISGYTHFVSGVELDHAQDIIADITNTLVRALHPPSAFPRPRRNRPRPSHDQRPAFSLYAGDGR